MDSVLVFLAKDLFVLIPVAALVLVFVLKKNVRYRYVGSLILALAIAYVLAKIASSIYFNPRPFTHPGVVSLFEHASDNGFPSDHTTYSSVIAFTILYFARKWGFVLVPVAVLVGLSRVWSNVHSYIDIAAGLFIGVVAASFAYEIVKFAWPKVAKRRTKKSEEG